MDSCSGSTVALNNDKQQEKEKKLENDSGVAASASGGGVEKSVVSGVFHRQRLLNLMCKVSSSMPTLSLAFFLPNWLIVSWGTLKNKISILTLSYSRNWAMVTLKTPLLLLFPLITGTCLKTPLSAMLSKVIFRTTADGLTCTT
ncbi:hypothetical protein FXO38_15312 [Capsicum annuum]|nr:hypothetical protein FXO38_15312 [Capsicum annuum]